MYQRGEFSSLSAFVMLFEDLRGFAVSLVLLSPFRLDLVLPLYRSISISSCSALPSFCLGEAFGLFYLVHLTVAANRHSFWDAVIYTSQHLYRKPSTAKA